MQLSLRESYDFYNINIEYFESIYSTYYAIIKDCFKKYKDKINNLDSNYLFYNSLKNILRNLQLKKILFYKDIINDFSKGYDFELLNITYNLGEEIFKYMLKDYYDYEFKFVYQYFEIFYNNTKTYDILCKNNTR